MLTQIHIIDNKKVSMTQEEWDYYNTLCRAYDRQSFKGEELFKDLFETNNDGIIIFLKPPSSRYTSMEVFLFIVALYNHQHMRLMHGQLQELLNDARCKIADLVSKK